MVEKDLENKIKIGELAAETEKSLAKKAKRNPTRRHLADKKAYKTKYLLNVRSLETRVTVACFVIATRSWLTWCYQVQCILHVK